MSEHSSPIDLKTSRVLPSVLFTWKQATRRASRRSSTVLTLLPNTSAGRLAFLINRRVYVGKTQGDTTTGRLLWSGERVVLSRLQAESEEHKDRQLAAVRSYLHAWHRNVQQIYGTCELDADILIVRARLDGWPLQTYLQETRSADRRAIVLDVARGLRYLHSQNIVHGDMSMGSIFVTRKGRSAVIATSFACPEVAIGAPLSGWATSSRYSDASPSSESDPELATRDPMRSERPFNPVTLHRKLDPTTAAAARAFLYSTDQRGDLFAFGHFVVEVFTGIPPYGTESALEILRKAATHRRPRHPGKVSLTRGLDKLLWRICRWCWNPDVGPHAPYTAEDIVQALERPRDDILICPFEWPHEEIDRFIWERVRRISEDEVKVVTRVTIGRDAEDGRYELRVLCRGPEVRVLKLIPYWAHRRDLRGNVITELFVGGQLQHAHVAPLVGLCRNPFDNTDCLAVPWMGGGTCVDYLRENRAADRLAIALQVADALAYLHGRAPPVIHGRIQAHSVWMAAAGAPHAYLSNFDFQPQLHPARGFDDSDVRSIVASGYWVAPEFGDSGMRRDVFAFAAFLYELYAGHAPFADKRLIEAYDAYAADERPARPDHAQLSDGVWALIGKCWRTVPYRRPSMKTVFRRLRELESARHVHDRVD